MYEKRSLKLNNNYIIFLKLIMDVIVKMNRRRRKSRSRSRPRIKRKSRRRSRRKSRPKKRKSVSRRSSPRIRFTSFGNTLMNMIVPFSPPKRRRSRSRSIPRIKRRSRSKPIYSVRIVDFNTDSPPSSTTSSSNTSLTTSTCTTACTSACTTSQANTPTTPPQQTSTINMNELRKAINEIKSQEDIDECPICLDEITDSDRFDVKCCKLKIHHTCFNNLVEHQNNDKCPQCRQNMTS